MKRNGAENHVLNCEITLLFEKVLNVFLMHSPTSYVVSDRRCDLLLIVRANRGYCSTEF